jgi:hypothetical protein
VPEAMIIADEAKTPVSVLTVNDAFW